MVFSTASLWGRGSKRRRIIEEADHAKKFSVEQF